MYLLWTTACALLLLLATPALADTETRLEVLRGRAAARVIVTDTTEPLVTEERRIKRGICTQDVIITRRGDQELTRSYAAPNCRKISE
jgi:hypothetical protein